MTDRTDADEPVSRRHLIRGLAGLGAVGVAGVAAAEPAGAADGDPLVLGQQNSAATQTDLTMTQGSRLQLLGNGSPVLLVANQDTGGGTAIWAETPDGIAVNASSTAGVGLLGWTADPGAVGSVGHNDSDGAGLGGASMGGGPQLWLWSAPGNTVGAPTTGSRDLGQIKLDPNGDLWLCVAAGTPGTWTRLLREDQATGRTVAITPMRVLGTNAIGGRPPGSPAVPGQLQGPLAGGQTVTLDLAGVAPIPATATAVVGNATVKSASGDGTFRIRPSDGSVPAAIVPFRAGVDVANAFTCALGPAGITLYAPVSSSVTYQVTIDIAAFIT